MLLSQAFDKEWMTRPKMLPPAQQRQVARSASAIYGHPQMQGSDAGSEGSQLQPKQSSPAGAYFVGKDYSRWANAS
jgi:hypothetical protein